MKKGWYFDCELLYFHGFYFHETEGPLPEMVNFRYGPFKTLKEAKNDALNYYRTDIAYARAAMASIQNEYKELRVKKAFKESK